MASQTKPQTIADAGGVIGEPFDWRAVLKALRDVKMSDSNFMLFIIQNQLAELIDIADDQLARLWDVAERAKP